MAEALVSIKRLQQFMMYDEVIPEQIKTEAQTDGKKSNLMENITNSMNQKTDLKKNDVQIPQEQQNHDDQHIVSIVNGNAKWLDYETENTLKNINIKVRRGELIAIVGQVGSGKSSLMNVFLKELGLREGTIQVHILYLMCKNIKLIKKSLYNKYILLCIYIFFYKIIKKNNLLFYIIKIHLIKFINEFS